MSYQYVDFFDDKAQQVVADKMEAFGIGIHSQYGRVKEIKEMLEFAEMATIFRVNRYIHSLYYDSEKIVCYIKIQDNYSEDHLKRIHELASKNIIQFKSPYTGKIIRWFDENRNGASCEKIDEELSECYDEIPDEEEHIVPGWVSSRMFDGKCYFGLMLISGVTICISQINQIEIDQDAQGEVWINATMLSGEEVSSLQPSSSLLLALKKSDKTRRPISIEISQVIAAFELPGFEDATKTPKNS